MTLYKYWVTLLFDYEHTGITIPENRFGATISIRVISDHELSEKDAVAEALIKWIACYDTKCYNNPRRTDKMPGDISIRNVKKMHIQSKIEDVPYQSLLEAFLANPNDFRDRI